MARRYDLKDRLAKSEAALHEKERAISTLMNSLPGAAYRCRNDRDWTAEFVSEGFLELTGYHPSDLLEKRVSGQEIIHPKDQEAVWNQTQEALKRKEPFQLTYRIRTASGEEKWVWERGEGVFSEQGELVALEGFVTDITEKKLAQDRLETSLSLLSTTLDSMDEGIAVLNLERKIEIYNQNFLEMLRFPQDILDSKDALQFTEFVATQLKDPGPFRKKVKELLSQPDMESRDVLEFKDGRVIERHSQPRRVGGKIVGRVASFRDIAEHKRAKDELFAEKERLSVTLASIADGVVATDTEGHITLINKVAEELTGWSRKQALGRPLQKVVHLTTTDGQPIYDEMTLSEIKESGRVRDISEGLLISRKGENIAISCKMAPIRGEQDEINGVVLTLHDMTQKMEAEKERIKSSKLESIGVLAGGIAHDFNNFLAGFLMNLSLLRQDANRSSVKRKNVLADLETECLRARSLTQQLLTFAKGGEPIKEVHSVARLLEEAANFTLTGSNVGLQRSIPDDLWTVHVDAGQIHQCFNNILINAKQSMPKGGTVVIKAENKSFDESAIEHGISIKKGDYVKISIRDQGGGIPQESLKNIFDPYFSTKAQGSGLGLTTAYSIVQKHGGRIAVESSVETGTTIHIDLPAYGKEPRIKMEEKDEALAGKGRILVLEDEAIIGTALRKLLTAAGFQVDLSRTGAKAIELYKQAQNDGKPYDAVILDLTVPGGRGGKEIMGELLKIDPETRGIVSSGYSADPVMSDFRKYGFSAALFKPYNISALKDCLDTVLVRS